jgi:hypothetical protein
MIGEFESIKTLCIIYVEGAIFIGNVKIVEIRT